MVNIQDFISKLHLQPHIEGGYFKETYRSNATTTNSNGAERNLNTLIYFLLPYGNYSKFHEIASDEIWVYQFGSPLIIHMIHQDGRYEKKILGIEINTGHEPQILIHANTIFGAEVIEAGAFSLSACMVSPGFNFEDFDLKDTESLIDQFPQHEEVIRHLHQSI